MNLLRLIENIGERQIFGQQDITIKGIVSDSKKAFPGSLFVAIPGFKSDGHLFLNDAYERGCRAFVTQEKFQAPDGCSVVVPDSRKALALICANFYGNPSRDMNLIGITGTNGKTTTAFLIEAILKEAGCKVGIITTVVYRFGSHVRQPAHTTPDPVELQQILDEMKKAEVEFVVMEVSSHALDQKRVEGCVFAAGVFTNLSPEHLDYHITMDAYYKAKERFFTDILSCNKERALAVVNSDDPKGRLIVNSLKCPSLQYGIKEGDLRVDRLDLSLGDIHAELCFSNQETIRIDSSLTGEFNLYNILASVATAKGLGIASPVIETAVRKVVPPPGRMEKIENTKGVQIFVDYAHTPDALDNVLKTLIGCGAKRIITVFGCGGDRDRSKRSVMGAIAAAWSSVVVITSDNPRTEDPLAIINEIERGVCQQGFHRGDDGVAYRCADRVYFVIENRKHAIKKAIEIAAEGDVVLIAGKGHETYQQIKATKVHFDDREEARQALAAA